jgi:DNA-binding CsgD family transcriptional regulator
MTRSELRPVERRVGQLVEAGASTDEIAQRFKRGNDWVRQVIALSEVPRGPHVPTHSRLRPVERRVLRWRAEGSNHAEIGSRFHRSAGSIRQIEHLALYKLAR